MLKLPKSQLLANKTIQISGSKSESNRLLILQKLWKSFTIDNLSNAQDTALLQEALATDNTVIDIHHAGTAMRFLTSYFAVQEGCTITLTGSQRMKERPIHHLVTALRDLGADIVYLENEGFPPLKIHGKKLTKHKVSIPAHISSQFITSLMLIGTTMEHGLEIHLVGAITSRPYLEMTVKLIASIIGENITFEDNTIRILPTQEALPIQNFTVESDWSSASYFYSLAAIGRENIQLNHFKRNSLQGDSALVSLYESYFGITTNFSNESTITLSPLEHFTFPERIVLDMNDCPDIAQTLCVTAAAMKIHFKISGLATLKVKETDRLVALQNELLKIGVKTHITEDSIESLAFSEVENPISIATYNDHRMAMSFAPYALIQALEIQNPEVVEKSYPDFWKDFFAVVK